MKVRIAFLLACAIAAVTLPAHAAPAQDADTIALINTASNCVRSEYNGAIEVKSIQRTASTAIVSIRLLPDSGYAQVVVQKQGEDWHCAGGYGGVESAQSLQRQFPRIAGLHALAVGKAGRQVFRGKIILQRNQRLTHMPPVAKQTIQY